MIALQPPVALWKCGRLFYLPLRGKRAAAHTEREKRNLRQISKTALVIAALAAAVVVMGGYIVFGQGRISAGTMVASASAAQPLELEQGQGAYVKPETPIDRSKNVTLPGWGGFTIPAGMTHITMGFEFHNPDKNLWYEDHVSVGGTELEKLVVDSGEATELNHYLKLAGIQSEAAEVTACDTAFFQLGKTDEGALTVEAIGPFEGTKTITVQTADGQSTDLTVTCQQECYYMTFGLYLADGDELLYQSGLVAPGNYIQTMDISRKLKAGEYDAYVVCQPYRSDKVTETNRGIVKITLTVG